MKQMEASSHHLESTDMLWQEKTKEGQSMRTTPSLYMYASWKSQLTLLSPVNSTDTGLIGDQSFFGAWLQTVVVKRKIDHIILGKR